MANEKINLDEFVAKFLAANEEIEPKSVSAETRLVDIPEWDSLALLLTITMLETEFDVEVSGDEVRQCPTINDLAQLVQSKRGGLPS